MKRLALLSLVLLLTLASAARARVLVVTEKVYPLNVHAYNWADTTLLTRAMFDMQDRMVAACGDVFRTTGMTYDAVPAHAVKTWWLKMGRYYPYLNSNPSDSTYTQYDAVFILNATGATDSLGPDNLRPWSGKSTGCYPCSLTTVTQYPRVPILFISGAQTAMTQTQYGSYNRALIQFGFPTPSCSTGAQWSSRHPILFPNGPTQAVSANPMMMLASTNRTRWWYSSANKLNACRYVPATVAGGVRPLLLSRTGELQSRLSQSTGVRLPVAWADSVRVFPAESSDSMYVWERLLTGWSYAASPTNARLVFADVMGASPCYDSTGSALGSWWNIPCEFDETTLVWAMAHMDSLTHGKVWEGSTSKLPIRGSVTIDGGFTRTPARPLAGGLLDSDSLAFKGTTDSIATLRPPVPVTVGVDTDSIPSYPWEIAWWNRIPQVRFSPQSWTGVDRYVPNPVFGVPAVDTTNALGGGNWSRLRPKDVFGRYRDRYFLGDDSGVGKDSSIATSLLVGRSIVNTYWPGKVSGLCMAPRDDYTPRNFFNVPGALDSLVYVIRRAGFVALRTDVQAGDAQPGMWRGARGLIRGAGLMQGDRTPDRLGGLEPLRILGQTGSSTTGSAFQFVVKAVDQDTAVLVQTSFGGPGTSTPHVPTTITGRFIHGMFHDEFRDVDWFPVDGNGSAGEGWQGAFYPKDDHVYPTRRASIMKLHASDFIGTDSRTGVVRRPGWWALKWTANWFQAVNDAAGRTVLMFDWPENITP